MIFARGTTDKARNLSREWLKDSLPEFIDNISIGLPEYDDRLDVWRVSLSRNNGSSNIIGELRISNDASKILSGTSIKLIRDRLKQIEDNHIDSSLFQTSKKSLFRPAPIPNKIILGDSTNVLDDFPPDTAQLVFTSPPYYNAKPEYSEYVDYQEYLDFIRRVVVRCHAILSEGRFFVINVSPVLIKRIARNASSKRLALPFDIHRIMDSAGFDFVDDIIWAKPEGAGWNLGRGRRFRADRQPLQYKPVPVTEYILVYRKKTDKLIDWNIRNHYDQSIVEKSKINGEYDVTNIWNIHPSSSKDHPATFPEELVRKIIRYYSFENDLVLDPFAGSGTVGRVAYAMNRRFLLVDREPKYYKYMKDSFVGLIPAATRVDFEVHIKTGVVKNND